MYLYIISIYFIIHSLLINLFSISIYLIIHSLLIYQYIISIHFVILLQGFPSHQFASASELDEKPSLCLWLVNEYIMLMAVPILSI